MIKNQDISAPHWADPDSVFLLLDQARKFAGEYINTLDERPIFRADASLRAMDVLDEPSPEGPNDPAQVLKTFQKIGGPATVAQTTGRYFGFVNGGMLPVSLAAKWLGDSWDQNS